MLTSRETLNDCRARQTLRAGRNLDDNRTHAGCPESVLSEREPAIFAAILAAGKGSRFGSTKQIVDFGGMPLARHACAAAGEAFGARMALVVGHDLQAVIRACMPLPGFVVVNDEFASGVGTSIARVTRALEHVADAIVVMLADQPYISAAHLSALAGRWTGSDYGIVATRFADTVGPPCLFGRACYPALASLHGDAGARDVLMNRRFDRVDATFEPAAIDIDHHEDIAMARAYSGEG